ncbi:MAG: winged helix-turn-helix domain-containing protein [Acidobacteriia bacterium]|nr:winged helix-turn-helix domain-containing protein [Terriglobia bacterium]
MPSRAGRVYAFGDFRLDPVKHSLVGRDGTPILLTQKAYDILAYLIERAGAVVCKDELMQAVWPGTAVEENNLSQSISLLRRTLGDSRGEHRCIATVAGYGYQFVAAVSEVGPAIEKAQTAAASIAVLPFMNLSADPDCEYFGDGLAEELIDAFSKLSPVRVVARTSSFSFKGKQADVREIANQLGANLVLEGSVRKFGNRLRITARLVDAADGYQLWSESYDRQIESGDTLAVQEEITPAVVDALKLKLPGANGSAPNDPAEDVRVRELYLKGRFYSYRLSHSGIHTAVPCFEEALKLRPSYALAQVGLAHAYRMFGMTLEMPTSVVGPKAIEAALKAVQMGDNLAEAHAVLALSLCTYEWRWSAAEKHLRRALELDPNSADALWIYSDFCAKLGRHREALERIARARELDPLSGLMNAMEGQYLLHAGRTDEAIARLRETIELDPKSRAAHWFLANAYIDKGSFAEAVAEAAAARALCPSNTQMIATESYANARLGRRAEARHALETLLQSARDRYVPSYSIAMMYNGLDEPGEALTWLERAFENRDVFMTSIKVAPIWKNLRDLARFIRLLKRIGLDS